jgi:hypothetical protein
MAELEALMEGMKVLIRARCYLFRQSSTYDGNLEDRVVSLESKSFHWTITSMRAVDCGWNANVTGIPSSKAKATSFETAQSVAKAWRETVTAVKDALKVSDRYVDDRTPFSPAGEASRKAISQMEQVKATMEHAASQLRLLRVPPSFTSFD